MKAWAISTTWALVDFLGSSWSLRFSSIRPRWQAVYCGYPNLSISKKYLRLLYPSPRFLTVPRQYITQCRIFDPKTLLAYLAYRYRIIRFHNNRVYNIAVQIFRWGFILYWEWWLDHPSLRYKERLAMGVLWWNRDANAGDKLRQLRHFTHLTLFSLLKQHCSRPKVSVSWCENRPAQHDGSL